MYKDRKASKNHALSDNRKLKMRVNKLIICIILTSTTNFSCLALHEQPSSTSDLINTDNSRTSLPISTNIDELTSSKLISSSNNDNGNTIINKVADNNFLTQNSPQLPESNIQVAASTQLPNSSNVTQADKLFVSSTNSPPSSNEQLSESESRESVDVDSAKYNTNYNYDQDEENQDGSDLNLSLMNAPHDKLQAVKHLLNTERSILASQNPQNDQSIAHASGLISQQCTYKGKQYLNGQNVPIEEQPCLNCTCRRAILQCYLRVCPPIISIEAHKKMQVLAKRASGENCQMVKEPHQCCPTLKCDPISVNNEETLNRPDNSSLNLDKSSPIQFITTPPTNRLSSQSDANTVSAGSDASLNGDSTKQDTKKLVIIRDENGNGITLRIQPQQQQQYANSPTNRSVDDSNINNKSSANNNQSPSVMMPTPQPQQPSSEFLQQDANLPKLTVIKGTSGQPDSILLITSNPSTVNNILHGGENLSSQSSNTSYSANGNQHVVGYSDALLNALLETVYSSVSQLNGLNLQGSCMINGSLYVEGSAVMPEGNAYCQYCYCIRQKIMCIKPKCHLMISGCSPKYSNEYACCPTSYSCSNSDTNSMQTNNLLPGKNKSSLQKLAITNEPQNLSAKLSAAIESMSRMSQPPRLERQAAGSSAGTSSSNDAISARQVDGSPLNPDPLRSAVLDLMQSIGLSMNSIEKQNSPNKTNSLNGTEPSSNSPLTFRTLTSDSPVVTTTTTSSNATAMMTTTSTSTATSAQTPSTSTTTSSSTTPAPTKPASSSSDKDEDSSKNDDDGGEEEEEEPEKQQDKPVNKNKKVQNNPTEMDKKLKSNSNSTTENPSSVSDFLEPMNKLGPHMVPVSTPPSCIENGRHYAIGEQIPTLESCKHCFCGLEAVKECHMVKCGLETLPHNCEPVTPEGHCCPVRYKCPPEINNQGNANQKRELSQQRYRSESSSSTLDSQPFSQTDISQSCNGESSELCSSNKSNSNLNSNNLYNYTDQSGNSEIENIKGLSEVNEPPPVVRTTRIVDNVPTNSWTPSTTPQDSSTGNNNSNGLSLTEELSKFIMQINQNTTTTSANQGTTTGYSMSPSMNSNSNINNTPTTPSVNTHEMMINDQHSRMFDYHSVQAPPTETNGVVGVPSIEPEPILNLMKGGRVLMANGEIVPVDPNMNKLLASTVEYAMKDKNFSNNLVEFNQGNHQNSGQRDSRSTNAHKLNHNEMITTNTDGHNTRDGRVNNNLIELANLSLPLNSHLAQVLPSTSPMPVPEIAISDDYIDENNGSNNTRDIEDNLAGTLQDPSSRQNVSNLPHVRLLRNNHNIPQNENNHFRNQNQNLNQNLNTSSLVFFDDPIGNYNGNNNSNNYNNLRYNNNNAYQNQNNPNNAYTTLNIVNNQTQPPYASRVEPFRPNINSSENDENSTPTPPQPTTGTPIGLDADRTPETRGWLKSLSGLVHSFGRRLVPVSSLVELDGAASDGKYRDNSLARQIPDEKAVETARSKQQSLLDHLMQILSNNEQNLAPNSELRQEPPKSLVMRPLASVVQVEADKDATPIPTTQTSFSSNNNNINNRPDNQRPWPTLSSPYEPVSPSEVEIVTAAVPSQFLEPELPETTLAKVAETAPQNNQDAFARRSDVGLDAGSGEVSETTPRMAISPPKIESKFLASDSKDSQGNDPMIGLDRSTFNRANKQLIVNKLNSNTQAKPQTRLLTCYDQASNKTYQANENWIPGDDPCKTCTCILGEERCQTLTCPEKPAENCREERRNGECCASYICGTNLMSQSNFNNQFVSTSTTAAPIRASGDISGSNARIVMSSMNNNQQLATPRAINLSQMGPTGINNNNINLSQQRQQVNSGFPQPPAQARNPNMMNKFQQQQQQVNTGNNQIMNNIPAADVNNMRRQQLPQNPFRINDLPNVLPPHLRFRPNLQGNQFVAPNNLADINQSKMLFFNQQGQSDQRFPLQNFISRRNDMNSNINFRIPLQDALNQIGGHQKPAIRSSSSSPSVVNPTILLPTQRVASPAGFNQPFGEQMANNNKNNININLQPMNSDNNNNNWRSPVVMNDKSNINHANNGGNLPSNILIPRMSGEQQPTLNGVENNLTGAGPASWQPSSFMMPNNLTQTNQNQRQQQPQQQIPTQPMTSARPAIDMTLAENSAPSTNEIGDKDRVHFQAPTSGNQVVFSQSSPIIPSADSGFRPIVPIMTGHQRSSSTIGQSNLQTQEASTTTKQSEFTEPSTTTTTTTKEPIIDNRQSTADTTMPLSANYNAQQQHELSSTQVLSKNEAQTLPGSTEYPASSMSPSSSAATTIVSPSPDETSGQSKEIDRNQQPATELTSTTTTTNLPSSSLATNPPSTTTTTSTTTPPQTTTTTFSTTNAESTVSRQEVDELSSKAPQPTEPTSSDQSNSFDPMSMFRVSECNIYGRIYPVGQVIKELSDTCKVCTCTSMGVECQNKCR